MTRRAAGLILLVFAGGCSGFSVGCGVEGPREIVVVAKGMTFTVPSDSDTSNPLIRLHAGERVTLTLRNEAPGLIHNIEIPAWNVKTDLIRAHETVSVTFDVPVTPGRVEYTCRPHSELMQGFVEVASP